MKIIILTGPADAIRIAHASAEEARLPATSIARAPLAGDTFAVLPSGVPEGILAEQEASDRALWKQVLHKSHPEVEWAEVDVRHDHAYVIEHSYE